jgi:BirA family biotin operon repressor/biotin-[acetyl-CoA-carboxylase] ligase
MAKPAGNWLAATTVYPAAHATGQPAVLYGRRRPVRALAILMAHQTPGLEWLNDVLLNGGKFQYSGNQRAELYVDWLSVGIGVNLAAVPTMSAMRRVCPARRRRSQRNAEI